MTDNRLKSSILTGKLNHTRFVPKVHSFTYNHCMLLLDLDDLSKSDHLPYLISHNKFGLFSIKDWLYIDASKRSIIKKIADLFGSSHSFSDSDSMLLITPPSLLGYSFNPASFFFRVSDTGTVLAAAVEVSNTYGESHIYFLHSGNDFDSGLTEFTHKKRFHVSPFIERKDNYTFKFSYSNSGMEIQINLYQEEQCVISTTYIANEIPLNNWNLFLSFWKISRTVLLTEIRILLQAYKLYALMKIPFVPKPEPLKETSKSQSPGFIRRLKFPFKPRNYI